MSVRSNIEYTSDAIEAFYRKHRIRWEQFYPSERAVFQKVQFNSDSAVLDIGCGCGGLGLALKERFGLERYTGVEINRQAAETARALNPAARFLCNDILAMGSNELAYESFDAVVSLSCIDWNVEFDAMLARSYRYVKAGGHLIASFRLTYHQSVLDLHDSYQYINFEGKREGERAPYVVLNCSELMERLRRLAPAYIYAFGYWGTPSLTAVTPFDRVVFAVLALRKPAAGEGETVVELDLPGELLTA